MSFCLLSFCLLSFCLLSFCLLSFCLLSFCILSFCLCLSVYCLSTYCLSVYCLSVFLFFSPPAMQMQMQCKGKFQLKCHEAIFPLMFSTVCQKFIFSRKLGKISRRRLNSLLFTDIRFQMDKNAFNVYLWDLMHNKQIYRSTFVKGLSYWNSSTFLRS